MPKAIKYTGQTLAPGQQPTKRIPNEQARRAEEIRRARAVGRVVTVGHPQGPHVGCRNPRCSVSVRNPQAFTREAREEGRAPVPADFKYIRAHTTKKIGGHRLRAIKEADPSVIEARECRACGAQTRFQRSEVGAGEVAA